jgi:hypothetical protein
MTTIQRAVAAVMTLAVAALVVACGSSNGGSSIPPAPTSLPGPVTTTAGQPAGSVDVCALLSPADILAATGRAVATKTPGPVMGIFDQGCSWELATGTGDVVAWSIDLGVITPGGRSYFDRYLGPDGEPISGLGDAAVEESAGGITAVKADTLVSVFVIAFGGDEKTITRNLTEAALAHVP